MGLMVLALSIAAPQPFQAVISSDWEEKSVAERTQAVPEVACVVNPNLWAEDGEGGAQPQQGTNWLTWQVFDPAYSYANSGLDHMPRIDYDSYDYIYATWSAANGSDFNNDTLWGMVSTDGGVSWQWLFKVWVISPSAWGCFQPSLSVSKVDNTIYVAWVPGQASGGSFYADVINVTTLQHLGGGVYGPINTYTATTYNGYNSPSIAADGQDSMYVYMDMVDWNNYLDVDTYRSSDKGQTWNFIDNWNSGTWITSATDAASREGLPGAVLSYAESDGTFGYPMVRIITPTSIGSWSTLATYTGLSYHIRNAWRGQKGIIAFVDDVNAANGDIAYHYTTNGGTTWSATQWFENAGTDHHAPSVHISQNGTFWLACESDPENNAYGYPAFRYSTTGAQGTWNDWDIGFVADFETYATQQLRWSTFLTIWQTDITERRGTARPLVLWRYFNNSDVYVSYPEPPTGAEEGKPVTKGVTPVRLGALMYRFEGAESVTLYNALGSVVYRGDGSLVKLPANGAYIAVVRAEGRSTNLKLSAF